MRVVHVVLAVAVAVALIISAGLTPDTARAAPLVLTIGEDYPCTRNGLADAVTENLTDTIIDFDCEDPRIDFYADDAIPVSGLVSIIGINNGNQIILDGNDQTNFFVIEETGSLSLYDTILQHGAAPANAYGIHEGGAINNHGELVIYTSNFRANNSSEYGGAISSSGRLNIFQSTFIFNHAGIHGGAIDQSGNLAWVENSTLSGNTAGELGSAINIHPGVEFFFRVSTIVQPRDTAPAFAISPYEFVPSAPSNPPTGPTVPSVFNVLFGGYGQHCLFQPGDYLDIANSLSNDDSCLVGETANWENQELLLGTLWQININNIAHGFHPLLLGSPAIGASFSCKAVDQIGRARLANGSCDIGAVEYLPIEIVTLCANRWSGAVSYPGRGDCGRGDRELIIPAYFDSTFCVNNWNGQMRSGSECTRSEHQVTITGDNETSLCVNRWNGTVRVSEQCSRSEVHEYL